MFSSIDYEINEFNKRTKQCKDLAVKNFIEWIRSSESGISCDAIDLKYCGEKEGFGIFAKKSIFLNQDIISIPKRLIITADVIAQIPEYKTILENDKYFEPFEVLMLFIYLERVYLNLLNESNDYFFKTFILSNPVLKNFYNTRKNKSKSNWLGENRNKHWFTAYMNLLPRDFNTALAYESKKESLKNNIEKDLPMSSRQLFQKQKNEFKLACDKITKVLQGFACQNLFIWAWSIVNTRCIWIDPSELIEDGDQSINVLKKTNISRDCIAIIPLVDMLNHSPNAQSFAFYNKSSKEYKVNARINPIVEGSQVYVCYGPYENAKLWIEYGFRLDKKNIFNRVDISID